MVRPMNTSTTDHHLPPVVDQYLTTLATRVAEALGDNLVGIYLHGSAVLGGFNPDRSDVDVLVVVHHGLSGQDHDGLASQLGSRALPVPAATLEMSVVTLDSARRPAAAPTYEMHINTLRGRFADGRGRADADLLLHYAIVRQRGRLLGPGMSPEEVFAPQPRPLVLAALATELDDALSSGEATAEYILLNACRNLAYLEEGHFYSKIGGGQWVVAQRPDVDPQLVRAALRRQDGTDPDAVIDATAVRGTAGRIAAELRAAAV
jgi:streptomycin 3"-adenylyltransferase